MTISFETFGDELTYDALPVEVLAILRREPPHFYWSMSMFRKRRTDNVEQATEAGRDCLEVKAS